MVFVVVVGYILANKPKQNVETGSLSAGPCQHYAPTATMAPYAPAAPGEATAVDLRVANNDSPGCNQTAFNFMTTGTLTSDWFENYSMQNGSYIAAGKYAFFRFYVTPPIGATPGNYTYNIQVSNASNPSLMASVPSMVTVNPLSAWEMVAPGQFGVETPAITPTKIGFQWAPQQNGALYSKYDIFQVDTNTNALTLLATIKQIPGVQTAFSYGYKNKYIKTGLTPNTPYVFKVRAYGYSGLYQDANFTSGGIIPVTTPVSGEDTTAPSAPTNVVVTPDAGSPNAGVSWTASTDNIWVAGYKIKTQSGNELFCEPTTMTVANTCFLRGLSAGTNYQIRVWAYDVAGNMKSSQPRSFTTNY